MRSMISLVVCAFLTVASVSFSAPEIDPAKAMIIEGVIAEGNIIPLGKELLKRAAAGESEVQLILSSPGGSVTTGFLFLNLMKSAQKNGLKVTCFVPTLAASMAYQILLNCDERHVLNHAFLLWHRARIGFMQGPFLAPALLTLGRQLDDLDSHIFSEVKRYMGREVDEETLRLHFEGETLHTGLNVHVMAPQFISSHSAVRGLFEALLDDTIPRNESMDRQDLNDSDFIYITDRETLEEGRVNASSN